MCQITSSLTRSANMRPDVERTGPVSSWHRTVRFGNGSIVYYCLLIPIVYDCIIFKGTYLGFSFHRQFELEEVFKKPKLIHGYFGCTIPMLKTNSWVVADWTPQQRNISDVSARLAGIILAAHLHHRYE